MRHSEEPESVRVGFLLDLEKEHLGGLRLGLFDKPGRRSIYDSYAVDLQTQSRIPD